MSAVSEVDNNAIVMDDDSDVVETWVRSMLPRIVAALAPIILAIVTAGLAWLQNVIGIDLQEHAAAYATFIGTMLLGGLGLAATWVFNAGQGQIKIASAKVTQVLGTNSGYALPPGEFDPEQVRDVVRRDPSIPDVPGEGGTSTRGGV